MRLGPGLSPVIPRIRALGNLRGPAPRPAYPLHGRRLRLPTPAPPLAALPHRLAEAPLWLAPCGDGRGTRGRLLQQKSSEREGRPPRSWLLVSAAHGHATGGSSSRAAARLGEGTQSPLPFSLAQIFARNSEGTPSQALRWEPGTQPPQIVQVICFPLCRLAVRGHCGCPPLSLICIN